MAKLTSFNYYTIWSNLLFYIVLGLYFITKKLPIELMVMATVNMIVVGIMGNTLLATNLKNITGKIDLDTKSCSYIESVNAILHTLPLIISIIWLFTSKRLNKNFNVVIVLGLLLGFMFIWMIVPDEKGNMFIAKVNAQYGTPKPYLYVLLVVIIAVMLTILKR